MRTDIGLSSVFVEDRRRPVENTEDYDRFGGDRDNRDSSYWQPRRLRRHPTLDVCPECSGRGIIVARRLVTFDYDYDNYHFLIEPARFCWHCEGRGLVDPKEQGASSSVRE